jgi:hypothetical protein
VSVVSLPEVDHLLIVFHAELITCVYGVQAALNLSNGDLILETDAQLVQQEFRADAPCDRPEGGLVKELKYLVSLNFIEFQFVFRNSDCNKAAHALAALGYECVEGVEIFSTLVPCDVHVIVAADSLAAEQ